ncbi:flavin reductase family protein [Phytohabitans houttuyneae]|jgi:flavin reductase (DIM6/NTAB) family NADH-FMN oxidoreductase RutF|uniref:Oxidoreductase n=1 Tax=Phytohabitans houttuyneae TaxID=1076126 RepID=A0A6V8KL99_9ACTN|nr:flavin reductase family protein [Phytohabitans houttuyneae]GFJ81435.1 oxidoreductase [Phytohabitans houttuyneae]
MTVDQRPSTKQNARRRALQAAAARLTTGVTLLTAAHEDTVHGATVSAASLVSRGPLIVAAGLRTGSTLTRLAVASGQFAVNVLSERQSLIADWFANPARPAGHKQFALIDWEPDPATGLPLLRSALSVLICRVHGHVGAGDHELLLGEVVDGTVGVGGPLLSFAGALHGAELRDVIRGRAGTSPCTTTLD